MEVTEAQNVVIEQGWTPQIKTRRNGKKYLYAAQWQKESKKTAWRYICSMSGLGEVTKEKIIAQINNREE